MVSSRCISVILWTLLSVNLLTLVFGGLVTWLGYAIPVRLKQFGLAPELAIGGGLASLLVASLGICGLNYSSHYALNVYGLACSLLVLLLLTGSSPDVWQDHQAQPRGPNRSQSRLLGLQAGGPAPPNDTGSWSTALLPLGGRAPGAGSLADQSAEQPLRLVDVIQYTLAGLLSVVLAAAFTLAHHLRRQDDELPLVWAGAGGQLATLAPECLAGHQQAARIRCTCPQVSASNSSRALDAAPPLVQCGLYHRGPVGRRWPSRSQSAENSDELAADGSSRISREVREPAGWSGGPGAPDQQLPGAKGEQPLEEGHRQPAARRRQLEACDNVNCNHGLLAAARARQQPLPEQYERPTGGWSATNSSDRPQYCIQRRHQRPQVSSSSPKSLMGAEIGGPLQADERAEHQEEQSAGEDDACRSMDSAASSAAAAAAPERQVDDADCWRLGAHTHAKEPESGAATGLGHTNRNRKRRESCGGSRGGQLSDGRLVVGASLAPPLGWRENDLAPMNNGADYAPNSLASCWCKRLDRHEQLHGSMGSLLAWPQQHQHQHQGQQTTLLGPQMGAHLGSLSQPMLFGSTLDEHECQHSMDPTATQLVVASEGAQSWSRCRHNVIKLKRDGQASQRRHHHHHHHHHHQHRHQHGQRAQDQPISPWCQTNWTNACGGANLDGNDNEADLSEPDQLEWASLKSTYAIARAKHLAIPSVSSTLRLAKKKKCERPGSVASPSAVASMATSSTAAAATVLLANTTTNGHQSGHLSDANHFEIDHLHSAGAMLDLDLVGSSALGVDF